MWDLHMCQVGAWYHHLHIYIYIYNFIASELSNER